MKRPDADGGVGHRDDGRAAQYQAQFGQLSSGLGDKLQHGGGIDLNSLTGVGMALAKALGAELAASRPNAGGEYHFLEQAYGGDVARLFAWARMTVIQTGSIATLSFVFGDYAQQIVPG